MLFFALFTVGYLFGVFTALAIFPPHVKEIEEQEKDALQPLISLEENNLAEESTLEPLGISSQKASIATSS